MYVCRSRLDNLLKGSDYIMIRTIKGALEEIKARDPKSDITMYAIRRMIKNNEIPYIRSGKKYLLNVEKLIDYVSGVKESD